MLYHCGVLDDQHSPKLARIKSQQWDTLPADLHRELSISLLTPGFPVSWWERALKRSRPMVDRFRAKLNPDLIPDAIENFHSVTREDCIRLSQQYGAKPIPVKIQIVADVRAGMSWPEAMKLYNMTEATLARTLNAPLLSSASLPHWFRGSIPGA